MGVLAAERIKLTSTRSPWWCSVLIAVWALLLAVGFAFLLNFEMSEYNKQVASGNVTMSEPPSADNAVAGLGFIGVPPFIPGFGYILVMIVAALAVTSEYRFGTIKASFLAVPNRAAVLAAKAGFIAVVMAVFSAVLTFLSFFILKGLTKSDVGAGLSLSGDLRVFYGVPIFIALVVFLSVGLGALLRQSAAALSLLIVWPTLIEPIVSVFGKVGSNIRVFLPFQNASRFLGLSADENAPWHWGQWGSLVYFTAFVVIVFAAALYVTNQRDA